MVWKITGFSRSRRKYWYLGLESHFSSLPISIDPLPLSSDLIGAIHLSQVSIIFIPSPNIFEFQWPYPIWLLPQHTHTHTHTKNLVEIIFTRHCNPFIQNVEKWPDIHQKSWGVYTARFLKYVCPFFNIMHKRVEMHQKMFF